MSRSHIEDLLMQIQRAFLEDPELTLTLGAAERRFAVDEATCCELLGALIDSSVLMRTDEGEYVRLFPGLAARTALSPDDQFRRGDGRAIRYRAA